MKKIHGQSVYGSVIDHRTRCSHYHGELDVIALKFKCCGRWFPCYECHAESTDHVAMVWPTSEFGEKAVLCGPCGAQLTVDEYLKCSHRCPACQSRFNPDCSKHAHLYFEISTAPA